MISQLLARLGYEKRDAHTFDPSWAAVSQHGFFRHSLSPRAMENLSAVVAATNAIARALASVAVYIYRRDDNGNRIEVPNHPLALLARYGVTNQQTWYDWMEHSLASVLLNGNSLSVILRDARGQLAGLKYVSWTSVTVQPLSSGGLRYDVSDPVTGRTASYLQDEVLHIRDRTDDGGKIGKSVLARAAESVNAVQNANLFASSFMQNSAQPSGVLSAPGAISKETAERLKATVEDYNTGPRRAGSFLVAGDGLEWKQLQLDPESCELLESRKFGVQEIARIFNVPPIFCGDFTSSTFTNATTMVQIFASFALGQWACKIEQEFSRSVLSAEYAMKIDLSDFQRGDPQVRWATYDIARKNDILTVNEIREAEGFNPIATGGARRR
jgi:HK97 family phage portal protein